MTNEMETERGTVKNKTREEKKLTLFRQNSYRSCKGISIYFAHSTPLMHLNNKTKIINTKHTHKHTRDRLEEKSMKQKQIVCVENVCDSLCCDVFVFAYGSKHCRNEIKKPESR